MLTLIKATKFVSENLHIVVVVYWYRYVLYGVCSDEYESYCILSTRETYNGKKTLNNQINFLHSLTYSLF